MSSAKNKSNMNQLAKQGLSGDFQSLAKMLTLVETDLTSQLSFLAKLKISKRAVRIGITGPPGAGKSTIVNLLIKELRNKNYSVAVLAVDPSSPFSGGALLGDRVRMGEHSSDKKVFIRSVGSRGGFGGVSSTTGSFAQILEAAGFDFVVIETVGVGQTELQIMNLVDVTAVVLVPESGDFIQTLKAGILEIADLFVVNKSDRPGADLLGQELKALGEQEGQPRPVLMTSALQEKGVSDLVGELISIGKSNQKNKAKILRRQMGELESLVFHQVQSRLKKKLLKMKMNNPYLDFQKLAKGRF